MVQELIFLEILACLSLFFPFVILTYLYYFGDSTFKRFIYVFGVRFISKFTNFIGTFDIGSDLTEMFCGEVCGSLGGKPH